MSLICFLVDNSAASSLRNPQGSAYLDLFKNSVESIVKARNKASKSASSNQADGSKGCGGSAYLGQQTSEQFCLLSTDVPPNNVKSTPKDSTAVLLTALRSIRACRRNSLSHALANALNFVTLWRSNQDLSQFGNGRVPGQMVGPCHIILITSRRLYSTYNFTSAAQNGISSLDKNEIKTYPNLSSTMPIEDFDAMSSAFSKRLRQPPLYDKVFRWDYLVHLVDFIDFDDHPLVMTEKSNSLACFLNFFDLSPILNYLPIQCLVSESYRLGEVMNFSSNYFKVHFKRLLTHYDDIIVDPSDLKKYDFSWQDSFVNISFNPKGTASYWPLPESWQLSQHSSLPIPVRESIPTVSYVCKRVDAIHNENFPFDKYELANCPLTAHILANVPPNKCWQLFILPGRTANLDSDLNSDQLSNQYQQFSFGYLRSSINLQSVKLFIMPFNYPALIPLIDELIKVLKLIPTPSWIQRFESYMTTVPSIYYPGLKRAFSKIGLSDIISDSPEPLPTEVTMMLKTARANAKTIVECIINETFIQKSTQDNALSEYDCKCIISRKRTFLSSNYLPNISNFLNSFDLDLNYSLGPPINISPSEPKLHKIEHQNDVELLLSLLPYDVPMKHIDKLVDLYSEFLDGKTVKQLDRIMAHRLLVSQSGNYIDHINKTTPDLRDIMPLPTRINMFGNPFKVNKISDDATPQVDDLLNDSYDEIELEASDQLLSSEQQPSRKTSLTKGPIPKDFSLLKNSRPINAKKFNNVNSAQKLETNENNPFSNNLDIIYSETECTDSEFDDVELKPLIFNDLNSDSNAKNDLPLISNHSNNDLPKTKEQPTHKKNIPLEDKPKLNGKIHSSEPQFDFNDLSISENYMQDSEFHQVLAELGYVLREPRRSTMISSRFDEIINKSVIKSFSNDMIFTIYEECVRFKRKYFVSKLNKLVPNLQQILYDNSNKNLTDNGNKTEEQIYINGILESKNNENG